MAAEKIKCPNCQNDDESLIEVIHTWTRVHPLAYKFLCNSCSKEWISEYPLGEKNNETNSKTR